MLPTSAEAIQSRLGDDDRVLDVGGWYKPFPRADWVLDLMPYATRRSSEGGGAERFGPDTWVQRDICDHEPWPFADDQFDFAICSHTLEDVRDPVWVCSELNRVARSGYIEVPSRQEEQAWGVNGSWVGWSHHHWLIEIEDSSIDFILKPHVIHGNPDYHLPWPLAEALTATERVQTLLWEGGFRFRERIFTEPAQVDAFLTGLVRTWQPRLEARQLPVSRRKRIRRAASTRIGALIRGR